jgi:alpha-glucosidase
MKERKVFANKPRRHAADPFRSVLPALLALLVWPASTAAADHTEVISPDGKVRIEIHFRNRDHLNWRLTFRDKPVIETSAMSMLVDRTDLGQGVESGRAEPYKINEQYPWRGGHSIAVNHCNGVKISLTHKASKVRFTLEIRAFNDGVAFRHLLPTADAPRLPDEATAFILPSGSTAWYHGLGGHYEAVHERKGIAEIAAAEWAAVPLTFKLPDSAGYAAITEAALVNYSGMALQADGKRGFNLVLGHKHPISYPFRLRYSNDVDRVSQPATIAGPITTPWRVVMVGADLNALVNSDIVHNLCPPPDPKFFPKGMGTDWIKPGRAVWKYLDGGPSTFESMKEFSRMAGELGFEYHVIEGFWSRWSDEQIRELVDFSRQRGVGLFFWKHSKELRTPEEREEFFKKLSRLGVVGAKIDFFDHEHKEIVDLYTTLLQEAAKHHLMVNFHGANKPTGEARTWPNELTREAVRGMESSRLRERARHDTTLPFTRYLAGHGDYTPVHFGARRGDTTWAHQIATAAVFDEPLLTYGAHPTNLLAHPARAMIQSIPAVWDETIVLPMSEIGEVAASARRYGKTWFLAILNGPTARNLQVPLSFLGNGEYESMIVRDRPGESAAVMIENATARRSDSLKIELSDGGGFIARFSQK